MSATTQTIQHTTNADAVPVNPGRILDLEWGFARTGTLMAALELGLFDRVEEGARTPETFADRAGVSERGARALMYAVCALGLLERDSGGRFHAAADADRYLRAGRPDYLGDMRHIYFDLNAALWPKLAAAVEDGKPVDDLFVASEAGQWESVLPFLTAVNRPVARSVADYVASANRTRVLDVGCGAGVYSHAIADRDRRIEVTAVDQGDVIALARRDAERLGVDARIRFVEGDLFELDWGTGYDLVLFSHLLHGFGPDRCRWLIARAAECLRPGGELLIHEFIPDVSAPDTTPIAALFGLELLMTSTGSAYFDDEYAQMLGEAGFDPPRDIGASRGATTVLAATRRG